MSIFLAELVGTALMIFFGVGVNASLSLNKSYAKGAGWIATAVGWGLAVTMAIFAVGNVSGAHLNCAVSFANAVVGDLEWSKLPVYVIAQILGAIIGSVLVYLVYLPHWEQTEEDKLSIFATGPAIDSPISNLISEAIGTFILLFTIYAVNNNELVGGLGPIIIGMIIVAIGLSAGGATGYAINPARDLGPRIAYSLLPLGGKKNPNWKYQWIPIVGPLVGGALGAMCFKAIF